MVIRVERKKEIDVYEKAESNWVGGEGDSSRAHGIPDGTGNDQLHESDVSLQFLRPFGSKRHSRAYRKESLQ